MAKSQPTSSINVRWEYTLPPVSAHHWKTWTPEEAQALVKPLPFEQSMHLAAGTVSVLDVAFAYKLSRSCGWDLADIPQLAAPFVDAAAIFRRGVELRGVETSALPEQLSGEYNIELFEQVDDLLKLVKSLNAAIIADQNVVQHWPAVAALNPAMTVISEEAHKTLDQVAEICRNHELGAASTWIIVGGGLLGDVAGFAAALSKKSFVFVPTTLLAMADACVGGKTGVNYPPYGKNQIGLFKFPERVLVCQEWLSSLPVAEYRSGLSECLKHAILSGQRGLMERLVSSSRNHKLTEADLVAVIKTKVDVIAEDPTEKSKRAILNFGHTLAHALEAYSHKNSKHPIPHGQAVAIGMVYATLLSEKLRLVSTSSSKSIVDAIVASNCAATSEQLFSLLNADGANGIELWQELYTFMQQDKKGASDGNVEFVLLEDWGKVHQFTTARYTRPVPEATLQQTWQQLLSALDAT